MCFARCRRDIERTENIAFYFITGTDRRTEFVSKAAEIYLLQRRKQMDPAAIVSSETKTGKKLYRVLNAVERVGNAVPNPSILFIALGVIVVIASAIVSGAGVTAQHSATNETIRAVNLLSVDGLHRILTGLVMNFTGFAPLGTVLVALLGLAVAEASGLIRTGLRLLVMSSPKNLLTVVVFAGVLSHTDIMLAFFAVLSPCLTGRISALSSP